MFGSHRRAMASACLIVGAAASCFKVDLIPKQFNGGALGGYAGDPSHDPADRKRELVTSIVKSELIDGYFAQGQTVPGETIDAWLARGALETPRFCAEVVDAATNVRANTAWTCPDAPESAIGEKRAMQTYGVDGGVDSLEHLSGLVRRWVPEDHRPVCSGAGVRDDAAIAQFSDRVRFQRGIERAVQALVPLLAEGLIDTRAIVDGSKMALQEARVYLRQRTWQRRIDRHVTGLVVQGGAVDGIYSAGAVWVILNVINGCNDDPVCSVGHTRDFRLRLLSGTSTGAMVSTATDVFNSCGDLDSNCRRAYLDRIVVWFTCLGLNDLYCVRNNSLADLVSTQAGALEFDGIGEQLRGVVSCDTMTKGSELILNTVDFRSGRLFDLSDEDPAQMRAPEDVVQGAIASAVLPAIARPVEHLPVNYDPRVPAIYLDGGIRSELPILPLVRRGVERVLVVSSSPSIVSETNYLKDALSIAKRFIDISTGGISESEILHAERQVESVRLAEIDACMDRASEVCGAACDAQMLCEGRWNAVCESGKGHGAARIPQAKARRVSEAMRINEMWQTLSIHRDEDRVPSVPGYQFDPNLARRLFEAGAEAARVRCLEIAKILGMDIDASEANIVKWCAPEAVSQAVCKDVKHKEKDPTQLRACTGPYTVPPSQGCLRRAP